MSKYYVIPMFPYPSGDSMHVGHASNYIINDFVARYKKMQGFDVIHPMGFDSFGLPTENYAIKTGKSARQATKENILNFKEQIKAINLQFDPDREFATSDPEYYKWTQWIFARLFEHGLAYKKDGLVNRCNGCQTVLANDQVVDGKCERCETIIIQKKHPQRYIKTTSLANELIDDLDSIDRPEETKTIQKNWIGRSYGAEIDFKVCRDDGLSRPQNTVTGLHKYIICDFDGVLGDSFETIAKGLEKMESFMGKTFNYKDAKEFTARYARSKPNHAKDTKLNSKELLTQKSQVKELGKIVHDLGFGLHREFIDALKRMNNTHIAVVSSGSEEYVQPAIIESGLEPTHILCYEDHHSKEEKIELICKDWGISKDEIYYVTDSLADVYELKDYIGEDKIIGVTRGQCNRKELESELKAECIIDNQSDIGSINLYETAVGSDVHVARLQNVNTITQETDTPKDGPYETIMVFTTRPDTLYGVTALVLAPENQIIDHLLSFEKAKELEVFRAEVAKLTSIDRQSTEREKNGINSGVFVTHPLTQGQVPVWFADYVLMDYATGAVMMVPAHDERDREFAKRYDIMIKRVIDGGDKESAHTESGALINSSQFDGIENIDAKIKITEHLESLGCGRKKTTFRLRDRSVSRQRYRGSPIPIYYTFEDNQKVPYRPAKEGIEIKEGMPIVTRQVVKVAIKHRSENKYLLIKNDKLDWHLVAGGVEAGETWEQAAIREAKEETIYTNFRIIKHIDSQVHSCFYNPNKEQNRYLVEELVVLQLIDNEESQSDLAGYQFKWIDESELGINLSYLNEQYNWFSYYDQSKKPIPPTFTDRNNAYNPHPDKSKWVPHLVQEEELPVILPLDLPNYKPAGKSPLEDHPTFKYYNKDNQTYLRECDTLDTFMCSSFYFLRYLDPANTSQLISHEAATNMPVDLYIGGKEHTVGHLIYSRFIYKFLQKYGYIETEAKEPFVKLIHQGMVHASDGRKFSKRRGNGINPLDVVKEHNTDTLRTYLAFMGPIELPKNWNSDGVAGVGRFLKRFEKLVEFIHISLSPSVGEAEAVGRGSGGGLISIIHQTIKAVGEDMDNLKFNTAISKLMIATNAIYEKGQVDNASLQNLIILLTPFAPETAQRMWTAIGQDSDVTKQARPTYDSQLIHNSTIELPIQINGKTKGSLSVSKDITQDEAVALVRQDEKMSKYLEGGIKKIIRVPGRICNIIINE